MVSMRSTDKNTNYAFKISSSIKLKIKKKKIVSF